jgi:tetratricopeptide (TPR) repeat protein
MAPVRGWLSRADRPIENRSNAPAHAIVAMTRTYERFMCGDMDGAREQSSLAVALGEQLGVQPAVVIGSVCAARVRIYDGDVEAGLAQLDEVGAWLMSGTVDPLTTGMMYCELICAAQGLALHERANEWTAVMDTWRHGAAVGGISGRCRVHRAEMLRMTGPCEAAEQEALGACDELRPWMRREFGWPLAELGMIRLRAGDLDGAEEALIAAHRHAWSAHPGLSLLRLERGDVEGARSLIADAIDHPIDIPSKERPPFGDLRLAPLYEAQTEIAFAAGDRETGAQASQRLSEIARTYGSPSLQASADLAAARTALMSDEPKSAIEAASRAVAAWTRIGAPFEAATARLVLGRAHAETGRRDAAELEWRAAEAAFEEFGARHRARLARDLCGARIPSDPAPARRTGTFRADGANRTIFFAGEHVTVRDLKGYRYLERLLEDPQREFHVLDLVAVERGTLPTARGTTAIDPEVRDLADTSGSGIPHLDETARRAYQRRLAEVDEDIDDARRLDDLGRLELAERDREYLLAELGRAVGLGGRFRSSGSDSERARTAVTRTLRYALGQLATHHEALAHHLERSIRTGTYCSYAPDAAAAVDWET